LRPTTFIEINDDDLQSASAHLHHMVLQPLLTYIYFLA